MKKTNSTISAKEVTKAGVAAAKIANSSAKELKKQRKTLAATVAMIAATESDEAAYFRLELGLKKKCESYRAQ